MIEDSHDGIITAIKELNTNLDNDIRELRTSIDNKFDNLAKKIDIVQTTATDAAREAFTALQKIQSIEDARSMSGIRLGTIEAEFQNFTARYDEREKLKKEMENSTNGKNNWVVPLIIGLGTIISMIVLELIIKGGKP